MLTDKYATLDFRGLGYLRAKWPPRVSPGSPPRWFGASALIAQPGYQCCVIYISHFMLVI